MSQSSSDDVVRWFARCADRYREAYLSHIHCQRLVGDAKYGLKLFLFTWAFERAGAPKAYRIAAVKAVSAMSGSPRALSELFEDYCRGKLNPNLNPALDPRLAKLDIPAIVDRVRTGALPDAFRALTLTGVGHKLRAFFLRDLVTLFKAESSLRREKEAHLWCQPIDVWVRTAASVLGRTRTLERPVRGSRTHPALSTADLAAARAIVELSLDRGVSPLAVNQGIWYFSSNVVADQRRLRELLDGGTPHSLDIELQLMNGFLPTRPTWG